MRCLVSIYRKKRKMDYLYFSVEIRGGIGKGDWKEITRWYRESCVIEVKGEKLIVGEML